jgi:hypothetical protein
MDPCLQVNVELMTMTIEQLRRTERDVIIRVKILAENEVGEFRCERYCDR